MLNEIKQCMQQEMLTKHAHVDSGLEMYLTVMSSATTTTNALTDSVMIIKCLVDVDESNLIDTRTDEGFRSMKFNITAGVIERSRIVTFERLLWRVSKGNVFVRFADIEQEMTDPKTSRPVLKSVFMIFYQARRSTIFWDKHEVNGITTYFRNRARR